MVPGEAAQRRRRQRVFCANESRVGSYLTRACVGRVSFGLVTESRAGDRKRASVASLRVLEPQVLGNYNRAFVSQH